MNKILGLFSGVGGIVSAILGMTSHDVQGVFNGIGAVGVGVLLFQVADIKERVARVEAIFFNEKRARGHNAS